jgi:acyl-CoA synthetase (AMP-forming)/AMP-acid ligase II
MAIQHSLAVDPLRDRAVSWLPFHHDMGLMGSLITPVLIQASTWYLPPLEFAGQPRRSLDLMNRTQATISNEERSMGATSNAASASPCVFHGCVELCTLCRKTRLPRA